MCMYVLLCMSSCLYVCFCVHVYVCVCVCLHDACHTQVSCACTHTPTHMYILCDAHYVHACMCVPAQTHTHTHTRIHTHTHTNEHVYICVFMCLYAYLCVCTHSLTAYGRTLPFFRPESALQRRGTFRVNKNKLKGKEEQQPSSESPDEKGQRMCTVPFLLLSLFSIVVTFFSLLSFIMTFFFFFSFIMTFSPPPLLHSVFFFSSPLL